MKKFFTLCILFVVGCISMNAQSFSFVDENGNVIENGTTLTMDKVGSMQEIIYGSEYPGGFIIVDKPTVPLGGVYVKNTSSQKKDCKIYYNVTTLPAGTSFAACCAGKCSSMTAEGTMEKDAKEVEPNSTVDISSQTEWVPGEAAGTCVVKLSIKGEGSLTTDSEITVNFVYSGSTSVNGIHNDVNNEVVARYSIDGQLLNAPQKGINILKYADGRTEKVIAK